MNKLTISNKLKEVLDEYLEEYRRLTDKIERMDNNIYQIAHSERYNDKTNKLICLKGIKEHTALAFIVEIGDFDRFKDAKAFSAYLGLTPREHSSSDKRRLGSITKDGNSHLRKLLIEAAQTYTRGSIGYKSKALKERQKGADDKIIHYADKAVVRLQKRYYHLIAENKIRNVAKVAIARELSSFIWGMMTNHLD